MSAFLHKPTAYRPRRRPVASFAWWPRRWSKVDAGTADGVMGALKLLLTLGGGGFFAVLAHRLIRAQFTRLGLPDFWAGALAKHCLGAIGTQTIKP